MNGQIDTLIRNTQRHLFEDGLTELFLGFLAILGGGVLWFPDSPLLAGIWFIIGVVVIVRIQEWLRARFTYPRSGFVTYREHKSQLSKTLLGTTVVILIICAILIMAIILNGWHNVRWIPLIVGTFIGVILIWQGIRLHLVRLVVLGIYSTLVGMIWSLLIAASQSTEFYYGLLIFGAYLFFFGIGALISGGIQFWQYLPQNHRITEATDE